MPFSVNLSLLFTEFPFLDRPRRAADAGFVAVECWWPFGEPVPPAGDVDAFAGAMQDSGVRLACLNFDGGDFAAGERGLLSLPSAVGQFRDNVGAAVEIAGRLDCRRLNALYGNAVDGLDPERQLEQAVAGLAYAARAASSVGATVVVEALNPKDYPTYGLHRTTDSAVLVELASASRTKAGILFDVYHVGMAGDDVAAEIERHASAIAHVQLADVPGRGSPGSGDLPFDAIFAALERTGYEGDIGLEYVPHGPSSEAFGWLPRDRRSCDTRAILGDMRRSSRGTER